MKNGLKELSVHPIPLGRIVHYVISTRYGNYILPAQIYAQHGPNVYGLRIFTGPATASEWLETASYSERNEPGTFNIKEEDE